MAIQKSQNIEIIIGDYKSFLDEVFQKLEAAGFSLDEFKELDHIAYRTESLENYEKIKNEIIEFSEAYSDKIFNGRPILICRLKNPLIYGNFSIKGFELPAPKSGKIYKEGLEHAEFVTRIALAEFRDKHRKISFNYSAYDREENPELAINFGNCSAKFHTQSILEIRKI